MIRIVMAIVPGLCNRNAAKDQANDCYFNYIDCCRGFEGYRPLYEYRSVFASFGERKRAEGDQSHFLYLIYVHVSVNVCVCVCMH